MRSTRWGKPGKVQGRAGTLWTVTLSILFTLTGVGSALFGAALPAFLAHWSLRDRDAGFLLFLAWCGSALGAFVTRGNLQRSTLRGVLLVVGTAFTLSHARRFSAFPLALGYGLGLGITMTSISRLQAERERSGGLQEMNRLNLLWAAGALSCPLLAARALASSNAAYLFQAVALAFAVFGLGAAFAGYRVPVPDRQAVTSPGSGLSRVPLVFCCVAILVVGLEATMAGWLTTYSRRADGSVAGAVSAASAFWAGLLLSRALSATVLLRMDALRQLSLHSVLAAVPLLLLTTAHSAAPLLLLTSLIGFALGPLYPSVLALTLPRFRGNGVFFSAGLGSALLPWATGILSSYAGSLRIGLAIPCVAGLCLVALVASIGRSRPLLLLCQNEQRTGQAR